MKCLQKIRDENTWRMKSRWGLNVSANSFKKVRNLKKVQVKIVDIYLYNISSFITSSLKKWF